MRAICLAVVLFIVSALATKDLTFQIEPKEIDCYYEQLEKGQQFQLQFEVTRGGLLDVKLVVSDPNDMVLIEKLAFFNRQDAGLNEAEGKVTFVAQIPGVHKICFDNRMSRWTAKVVSFTVVGATKAATADEVAKVGDLGPVVDSIIKLSDTLAEIEKTQHVLRTNEQSHRDATDTTNGRVQWLAPTSSAFLITLSLFQLRYIRNWFSDTAKPGRV